MALAVDASTPARVTGSSTNGTVAVTTGTFNPPACVLVATVEANARPHGATGAITNNGTGLTWSTFVERSNADASAQNGFAGIYWATLATSQVGMTVTATLTSSVGTATEINTPSIKVYVVTGAAASPAGNSAEGSSTTDSITTTSFSTAGASSLLFVAGCDWNALGTPSSSDLTIDAFTNANISGLSGYKALGGTGSSATANLDAAGAGSPAWDWVSCEVLAAAAAGVAPPYPGLLVSQLRPYFG